MMISYLITSESCLDSSWFWKFLVFLFIWSNESEKKNSLWRTWQLFEHFRKHLITSCCIGIGEKDLLLSKCRSKISSTEKIFHRCFFIIFNKKPKKIETINTKKLLIYPKIDVELHAVSKLKIKSFHSPSHWKLNQSLLSDLSLLLEENETKRKYIPNDRKGIEQTWSLTLQLMSLCSIIISRGILWIECNHLIEAFDSFN